MEIKIDTNKNKLYVTKEVAEEVKKITDEEHKINKMTIADIEADMKTKPEADQKEFEAFMKEEKAKIKGQKTKKGEDRKVNAMKIKTWYKNKYFQRPKKK